MHATRSCSLAGIPVMRVTERQVADDLRATIDRLARALAHRGWTETHDMDAFRSTGSA